MVGASRWREVHLSVAEFVDAAEPHKRKGNPQNIRKLLVGGTVAVSPTGDFMLGAVQVSPVRPNRPR